MIEFETDSDCLIAHPTVHTIFERETTELIYEQIRDHIDSGSHKLIIDFSCVESISSNFIGMLVRLKKELSPEGGDIRLCHLNDRLEEIARITKLYELLGIFPDRKRAVSSYTG